VKKECVMATSKTAFSPNSIIIRSQNNPIRSRVITEKSDQTYKNNQTSHVQHIQLSQRPGSRLA